MTVKNWDSFSRGGRTMNGAGDRPRRVGHSGNGRSGIMSLFGDVVGGGPWCRRRHSSSVIPTHGRIGTTEVSAHESAGFGGAGGGDLHGMRTKGQGIVDL